MTNRGDHSGSIGQVYRWLATGTILLAWVLRLCCLEEVPPGWRDDELIEIHALSGEVLAGHFPLYFTGASGHEPLYHYLQAGVQAVLGYNVLSGRLLSATLGTLNIALLYPLARRLLRSGTDALIATFGLAFSFWALMYSRFGLRHISALTFALPALYWLTRYLGDQQPRLRDAVRAGISLGIGLYTYFASRVFPVVVLAYGLYLAIFHRRVFRRCGLGLGLALVIAFVVMLPLVKAIGGLADARIAELAEPLRRLAAGDPYPVLENTLATLGMFHRTGDPEWLYNIPGRPLFNIPGAVLLGVGVGVSLRRWRQPCYALLLFWLGLGLAPAWISIPPASLSHTLAAQPAVYLLWAVGIVESGRWVRGRGVRHGIVVPSLGTIVLATVLATNVVRDLRDYFVVWPQQDMVRYLYRADYRQLGRYLAERPELKDVAVGSTLFGPWDRIAIKVDAQGADVRVRLFNPERALVWTTPYTSPVFLTFYPLPEPPIAEWLGSDCGVVREPTLRLCWLRPLSLSETPLSELARRSPRPFVHFANGLDLFGVTVLEAQRLSSEGGNALVLVTLWRVGERLELPEMPIVAYPPPPGVYSGPRLSVFAHLIDSEGQLVATDDGLWVDPATLCPWDWFVQVHHFTVIPAEASETLVAELGLYDPMTGGRWSILDEVGRPVGDRVVWNVPRTG